MKLAFCLSKYFPYGGLQRDFLTIAQRCLLRGHHVEVYTLSWQGTCPPGLVRHVVPTRAWRNTTRYQQLSLALARAKEKHAFDAVIGFNKMPGLDLYYAADPCYQHKAITQRSFWYRLGARYRHFAAYERAVFDASSHTHILSLSPIELTRYQTYYQTPITRCHALPPGINPAYRRPENADEERAKFRQTRRIKTDDQVLLLVGSGFKTKGLDRVLQALSALESSQLARTHLFVLGQDNAKPFLRLAKQLRVADRVTFCGGRDDVLSFLLGADLLLHPAYAENTGTVILEAMIAGLPVLVTDSCGYAPYVEQANAGVVMPSPFSQRDFNAALSDALQGRQTAMWRNNALAFAQTADIYSMSEHAVALIEQHARAN